MKEKEKGQYYMTEDLEFWNSLDKDEQDSYIEALCDMFEYEFGMEDD